MFSLSFLVHIKSALAQQNKTKALQIAAPPWGPPLLPQVASKLYFHAGITPSLIDIQVKTVFSILLYFQMFLVALIGWQQR